MHPSEKVQRLYLLDALRGLCALSIMFYHFAYFNGIDYFQVGTFGVYIFFVLSGFAMWYVYVQRPLTIEMLKSFFVARFARLFPLYFLICVLSIGARSHMPDYDFNLYFVEKFVINTTFLFGLSGPGKTSIIPGGWSIGIEWAFYLVFPLLLLFVRSRRNMVVLLIAAIVLNQLYGYGLLIGQSLAYQWYNYINFPPFLAYFMGGIVAADIYISRRKKGALPGHYALIARIVPCLCLAFVFLFQAPSTEEFLVGHHFSLLLGAVMLAVFCGALLINPSAAERKIYGFLGDISYSLYLTHFFVYKTFEAILPRLFPGHGLPLQIGLSALATITLSYLLYRFFERPSRDWLNRKLN